MSTGKEALKLDERVKAEDLLYADMFHTGETGIKWASFGVSLLISLVVLIVNFPEFKKMVPTKKANVIVVRKYVPPPPKVERRQVQKKKFTRRVPIPDPTPDEPEPIREPEPEIEPEPLPPDVEFLIGTPTAPPASGPMVVGAGVTAPEVIPESKIRPNYPELARVARMEGRVILQAIILKDGSVGEAEVLSCNRPNMGFEGAAMDAVKQWRYRPARQGDRPVDVYFTVVVEFELN